VALPLIPHEFFGVNCCGCPVEMIGEETQFVCNECELVISVEDVHRAAMEIESTELLAPLSPSQPDQRSCYLRTRSFVSAAVVVWAIGYAHERRGRKRIAEASKKRWVAVRKVAAKKVASCHLRPGIAGLRSRAKLWYHYRKE
jgi:hypothetical protein